MENKVVWEDLDDSIKNYLRNKVGVNATPMEIINYLHTTRKLTINDIDMYIIDIGFVGYLRQLEEFSLCFCNVEKGFDSLKNLTNLTRLTLHTVETQHKNALRFISHLHNLTELVIVYGDYETEMFEQINWSNLQYLTDIELYGNKITNINFLKKTKANLLSIGRNLITDLSPLFSSKDSLKYLRISILKESPQHTFFERNYIDYVKKNMPNTNIEDDSATF